MAITHDLKQEPYDTKGLVEFLYGTLEKKRAKQLNQLIASARKPALIRDFGFLLAGVVRHTRLHEEYEQVQQILKDHAVTCPSFTLLNDYDAGTFDEYPDLRSYVTQHIKHCSACDKIIKHLHEPLKPELKTFLEWIKCDDRA